MNSPLNSLYPWIHQLIHCTRGCQFVLFMQITTFSTCKHKPNLQVKAKKTVCMTPELLLFSIFSFAQDTGNQEIKRRHSRTLSKSIEICVTVTTKIKQWEEYLWRLFRFKHYQRVNRSNSSQDLCNICEHKHKEKLACTWNCL